MPLKMAVAQRPFFYNALFKKNYVMLGVVFAGAFGWSMFYDTTMNKVWDYNNRGRQWKDIRHKYVEGGEDEE